MDKKTFWKIIDEVNASVDSGDREAVLKKTTEKLMEYELDEIRQWKNILNYYHDLADREHLRAAFTAIGGSLSLPGFEYFRSWLIAQGHDVYVNALHDPDTLAEINIPENYAEFEEYWYITGYAYDKKQVYMKLGEEGVKDAFEKWMEQEGKKIGEYHRHFPNPEFSEAYYLEREFINKMCHEHGMNYGFEIKVPEEEVVKEILEEIHPGEDISNDWSLRQLKDIVPELYEKYSPIMRMQ